MTTFLEWFNNRNDPKRIQENYQANMVDKTGSGTADIQICKHYNGSGARSFSGAKEWVHISLSTGFPVETSKEDVQTFLHDLRILLNKHGYKKSI